MQVGESVAVVMQMQDDGKCAICGQTHKEPKKEEFQETAPSDKGWHRKSMGNILERIPAKLAIYPNNIFPPTYQYQGHHCMALSALVVNANSSSPQDKRLRLNHYLKKVGFYPNRDENCIGLPARKHYSDFIAFWSAIDGGKPLQMHGPGHDETYFTKVNNLINRMVSVITNTDICKEFTKDEWESELRKMIKNAENYAFNKLAKNESSWCLHRDEQQIAIQIYKAPIDSNFSVRGANDSQLSIKGKGNPNASIEFPNPNLNEGPFSGT